jgi:hypothetical protein
MQALLSASQKEQDQREQALRATIAKHLDLQPAEGDRSGFAIFKSFCERWELVAYPARPATVAYFVIEQAALGIAELSRIVKAISLVHENVADPTASGMVPAALNKIAPIAEPRSWPKDQKVLFRTLSYEIQRYLVDREAARDKAVRQAQNEAADARKTLKAIEQPKQETNGIHQNAAA